MVQGKENKLECAMRQSKLVINLSSPSHSHLHLKHLTAHHAEPNMRTRPAIGIFQSIRHADLLYEVSTLMYRL